MKKQDELANAYEQAFNAQAATKDEPLNINLDALQQAFLELLAIDDAPVETPKQQTLEFLVFSGVAESKHTESPYALTN